MSAFSRFLRPSSRGNVDLGLLLLRVGFGLTLAFGHGIGKLVNPAKFLRSVTRHGFPLPEVMAPIAALSEFVGGLLIAIGLVTRPAAVFVIATMLGAAFVAHGGEPFSEKESALAYALVAVVVLVAGPGRYSLDARLEKRR